MRSILLATAILAGLAAAAQQAQAHGPHTWPVCRAPEYGRPDLFYNFYVGPDCGSVGAQMYLAPRPVPAYVGHTYYTYQPFMPHELLYKHARTYHRYYNEGRGLTRTHKSAILLVKIVYDAIQVLQIFISLGQTLVELGVDAPVKHA